MWYFIPFITVIDYILLVERISEWRTNTVLKGLKSTLINIMLSENGFSSNVVRSKLPLFGLIYSRRVKIMSFIINSPFSIFKIIYTFNVYLILLMFHQANILTRMVTILIVSPSIGFFAVEYYLTTIRRLPYYLSKQFFELNRSNFYNLGLSIIIPKQIPFGSFLFGYIEIFEVALFAIDMEMGRNNDLNEFNPMNSFKINVNNDFQIPDGFLDS